MAGRCLEASFLMPCSSYLPEGEPSAPDSSRLIPLTFWGCGFYSEYTLENSGELSRGS